MVMGSSATPLGEVLDSTENDDAMATFRHHVMYEVMARTGERASMVRRKSYAFYPGEGWGETEWARRQTERMFSEIAQAGGFTLQAIMAIAGGADEASAHDE